MLDTGCPSSFGNGLAGVPGVDPEPPQTPGNGLTIGWLTEQMHHNFDGLIGAEVLRSRTLTIDPVDGTIEFSTEVIGGRLGVPVRDRMNVPIVDGIVRGQSLPVIFDTGAPLGFVTKELVEGLTPVDRLVEFYPLFGAFETDVYELPLEIGAERQILRFGTFPDQIEQMHAQAGLPVLIGLGLLDHYRISVGLREGRLLLEPIDFDKYCLAPCDLP